VTIAISATPTTMTGPMDWRGAAPVQDARAIDSRVKHDALRGDLVGPRQYQDDRQPDHRQDGQCRHPPFGEPQRCERDLGNLQHDPHTDQVGRRDLEDVPAPEFREQVLHAAAERGLRGVAGREEIRRPGNRRHLFEVSDQGVRVVADTCDVTGMAGLVAEQLAQLADRTTQLLRSALAVGPDLVAQRAVVHCLAVP
jgi:hypothetical protein